MSDKIRIETTADELRRGITLHTGQSYLIVVRRPCCLEVALPISEEHLKEGTLNISGPGLSKSIPLADGFDGNDGFLSFRFFGVRAAGRYTLTCDLKDTTGLVLFSGELGEHVSSIGTAKPCNPLVIELPPPPSEPEDLDYDTDEHGPDNEPRRLFGDIPSELVD